MKKLFLTLLVFMFCAGVANAQATYIGTASWKAPIDGGPVDGYYLRYSIIGQDDIGLVKIGVNETTCEITDLIQDTRYRFWLKAFNSTGESEGASTKYYTTPKIQTVPGDPTELIIIFKVKIVHP